MTDTHTYIHIYIYIYIYIYTLNLKSASHYKLKGDGVLLNYTGIPISSEIYSCVPNHYFDTLFQL